MSIYNILLSFRWFRLLHACLSSLILIAQTSPNGEVKICEDFVNRCSKLKSKNNSGAVRALCSRVNACAQELSQVRSGKNRLRMFDVRFVVLRFPIFSGPDTTNFKTRWNWRVLVFPGSACDRLAAEWKWRSLPAFQSCRAQAAMLGRIRAHHFGGLRQNAFQLCPLQHSANTKVQTPKPFSLHFSFTSEH